MVPAAAYPPVTPFTLQTTDVFVVSLTVAVKPFVVPRRTDAVGGEIVTVIWGGGGGGPEPTTPPQPRSDATKTNAGCQWDGVYVG